MIDKARSAKHVSKLTSIKFVQKLFSRRFGFKIWSLSASSGFVVQVEPYCGSSTNIPKHFSNMGPDVVVGLVTKAGVVSGSEVYFDNLFTSIPLMVWLSSKGIL